MVSEGSTFYDMEWRPRAKTKVVVANMCREQPEVGVEEDVFSRPQHARYMSLKVHYSLWLIYVH